MHESVARELRGPIWISGFGAVSRRRPARPFSNRPPVHHPRTWADFRLRQCANMVHVAACRANVTLDFGAGTGAFSRAPARGVRPGRARAASSSNTWSHRARRGHFHGASPASRRRAVLLDRVARNLR